jgi:DNA-binding LacI/PurR family transcriptional regulator
MAAFKDLKKVKSQSGRPLYESVKDALCHAIDDGVFVPGDQMPSTKQVSEQLGVSLVTAHRALQELVLCGVLERSQGRGTFVHERYFQRKELATGTRIGLVFHREASLADFFHGQIFDGVHRAAGAAGIDLILLRFGEDIRNECNGYLYVNPFPEEIAQLAADLKNGHSGLVVGAQSDAIGLPAYDVDNVEIGRLAVRHLHSLGHTRIGYVGAAYKISNSRDRWNGFNDGCDALGIHCEESHLVKGGGWRLNDVELAMLSEVLSRDDRPTAIFAAGYSFALATYSAAKKAGLRLPDDLSIVGVDDPIGSDHLAPPITTVRQPLFELGQEAIGALSKQLRNGAAMTSRKFPPQLIVRQSTAPLAGATAAKAASMTASSREPSPGQLPGAQMPAGDHSRPLSRPAGAAHPAPAHRTAAPPPAQPASSPTRTPTY